MIFIIMLVNLICLKKVGEICGFCFILSWSVAYCDSGGKKNPSVELKGVFRDQSCYGVFRETIMGLYYVLED